ncbi:hypothetical protein HMPREF3157_04360 [Dermabacter sp. HMSC06F07]|nr:hypothetical protein HMPREF3157_04360 [Dermabacter sp. HMSC06F07]
MEIQAVNDGLTNVGRQHFQERAGSKSFWSKFFGREASFGFSLEFGDSLGCKSGYSVDDFVAHRFLLGMCTFRTGIA